MSDDLPDEFPMRVNRPVLRSKKGRDAKVAPSVRTEKELKAVTERAYGRSEKPNKGIPVQFFVPTDALWALRAGLPKVRTRSVAAFARAAVREKAIADGIIREEDWPLD